MLCIGHRGAKGHAPENTLASFRAAIEMGVHAVELDVHSVEGKLVVIHDRDVSRTTDGTGELASFTLAELRGLDAGEGERIPALDEVLAAIDRQIGVNIEIKGTGLADSVVTSVQQALAAGWDRDAFLISSFDHAELVRAREIDPSVLIGVLAGDQAEPALATALSIGARALIPARELVTPALVEEAHDVGLRLIAYTVNEPAEIAALGEMGVDGLISDYPDRVLARWPSACDSACW